MNDAFARSTSPSSAPGRPARGPRTRSRARGARVTIFDPSHPREKPCGGGVTGRALALVAGAIGRSASAGVADPIGAIRRHVDGTRRDRAARRRCDSAPDARRRQPRRRSTPRCSAAACRAGATLVAVRVTDVALDPGGVRIETTAGTASRRLSRRRRRRQQPGPAPAGAAVPPRRVVDRHRLLRARRHQRRDRHRADRRSARLHLVVSAARPSGDRHLRAGRRGHHGRDACAREPLRGSATTRIAEGARLEPYSWPIPSLGARSLAALELAGPRWCIVGDAAGLVDPITREGIFFALAVGSMGRRRGASPATRRGYAARVRAEICARARARGAAQGWILPARLHRPADRRAPAQRARFDAVMADLIAGRQSYAGLKMAAGCERWSGGLRVARRVAQRREVSVARADARVRSR